MYELHRRSIAKAISWRIIASLTVVVLVYAFTGKLAESLSIGMLDLSIKLFLFYLHERAWNKIHWGKVYISEAERVEYENAATASHNPNP